MWQEKEREKEIEQFVKTIVFCVNFVIMEKDGVRNCLALFCYWPGREQ
jgi:hypothetical protein